MQPVPSSLCSESPKLTRPLTFTPQNDAFIFYSQYTEAQLLVPAGFLLENLSQPGFEERFVFKKYSAKSASLSLSLRLCRSRASRLTR